MTHGNSGVAAETHYSGGRVHRKTIRHVDVWMDGWLDNPERNPVRDCRRPETGVEVHLQGGQPPLNMEPKIRKMGLDKSRFLCIHVPVKSN